MEPTKKDKELAPRRDTGLILSNFDMGSPYVPHVSYSIENTTGTDIENLTYSLVFRNVESKKLIHSEILKYPDIIPAGSTKRFVGRLQKLTGLSTDQKYLEPALRSLADGVIEAELGIFWFDIINMKQPG